jgi:hypothetical protein
VSDYWRPKGCDARGVLRCDSSKLEVAGGSAELVHFRAMRLHRLRDINSALAELIGDVLPINGGVVWGVQSRACS